MPERGWARIVQDLGRELDKGESADALNDVLNHRPPVRLVVFIAIVSLRYLLHEM